MYISNRKARSQIIITETYFSVTYFFLRFALSWMGKPPQGAFLHRFFQSHNWNFEM